MSGGGRLVLLLAAALLAGCRHEGRPAAVSPAKSFEHLPVEAVLWQAQGSVVDPGKVLSREGVLRRTTPPEAGAGQVRYWPFQIDYWGIMRTDLDDVLAPYTGRPVRVEGEYRRTYAHEKEIFEVEPVRITLLPTP